MGDSAERRLPCGSAPWDSSGDFGPRHRACKTQGWKWALFPKPSLPEIAVETFTVLPCRSSFCSRSSKTVSEGTKWACGSSRQACSVPSKGTQPGSVPGAPSCSLCQLPVPQDLLVCNSLHDGGQGGLSDPHAHRWSWDGSQRLLSEELGVCLCCRWRGRPSSSP